MRFTQMQKKKSLWKSFGLKEDLELDGTLLAKLRLEEEYNYNILLRITSENFKEIFQLIKDNILKENTDLREIIPPRL